MEVETQTRSQCCEEILSVHLGILLCVSPLQLQQFCGTWCTWTPDYYVSTLVKVVVAFSLWKIAHPWQLEIVAAWDWMHVNPPPSAHRVLMTCSKATASANCQQITVQFWMCEEYLSSQGHCWRQTIWGPCHLQTQRAKLPPSPVQPRSVLAESTSAATLDPGVCWNSCCTKKRNPKSQQWGPDVLRIIQELWVPHTVLTHCSYRTWFLGSRCRWRRCRHTFPQPGD